MTSCSAFLALHLPPPGWGGGRGRGGEGEGAQGRAEQRGRCTSGGPTAAALQRLPPTSLAGGEEGTGGGSCPLCTPQGEGKRAGSTSLPQTAAGPGPGADSPRVELVDDALEADDGEEAGAEAGQPGQEEDGEGEQRLPARRLRQAPRQPARPGPGPAVQQRRRVGVGVVRLVLAAVGARVLRHVAPRETRRLSASRPGGGAAAAPHSRPAAAAALSRGPPAPAALTIPVRREQESASGRERGKGRAAREAGEGEGDGAGEEGPAAGAGRQAARRAVGRPAAGEPVRPAGTSPARGREEPGDWEEGKEEVGGTNPLLSFSDRNSQSTCHRATGTSKGRGRPRRSLPIGAKLGEYSSAGGLFRRGGE